MAGFKAFVVSALGTIVGIFAVRYIDKKLENLRDYIQEGRRKADELRKQKSAYSSEPGAPLVHED